jgi:Concanavalin A-like lectin/glucanases superfamily/VanZ like family
LNSRVNDNYTNKLKNILDRLSPEDGEYICRFIYRDPFKGVYLKLLLIYVFILGSFLLWPFDFFSIIRNDARWLENSKGVEFLETGQAVSNSATQEFFDRLVKGRGLTLEMWLQTEDIYQSGPARILSYSKDLVLRNFTVGQSKDELVVRIRTTKTSLNGMNPHLIVDDIFNQKGLLHMVIVYDFLEQKVYINGEQRAQSNILKGDFSNWDPSCRLAIGNEVTGNRPWKGKMYYAAVFDRALTEHEIRQNYFSGLQLKIKKGGTKHKSFKGKGPVARYLFDEGKEDVIHDSGSSLNPVNLFMPHYIRLKTGPFLGASIDYLHNKLQISDIIINILIFIPLGILIHGMLRTRFSLTLKISMAALLTGTLFSLSIESLQYFLLTRNSSLIDVFTNMTGTAIGIAIDRCYNLFLNYQAKHFRGHLYDRKV